MGHIGPSGMADPGFLVEEIELTFSMKSTGAAALIDVTGMDRAEAGLL